MEEPDALCKVVFAAICYGANPMKYVHMLIQWRNQETKAKVVFTDICYR
jgi:hypothetical protein